MSSRHRSREQALQVLYLWDMRYRPPAAEPAARGGPEGESPPESYSIEEALEAFYGLAPAGPTGAPATRDAFTEELVRGVASERNRIDRHILEHSTNWRLERMSVVDRNILRLAVYEMLYLGTPAPIVIDEALELAQRFSGATSVPFINGVLDAVWQKREV